MMALRQESKLGLPSDLLNNVSRNKEGYCDTFVLMGLYPAEQSFNVQAIVKWDGYIKVYWS